jgi:hypothetical protein
MILVFIFYIYIFIKNFGPKILFVNKENINTLVEIVFIVRDSIYKLLSYLYTWIYIHVYSVDIMLHSLVIFTIILITCSALFSILVFMVCESTKIIYIEHQFIYLIVCFICYIIIPTSITWYILYWGSKYLEYLCLINCIIFKYSAYWKFFFIIYASIGGITILLVGLIWDISGNNISVKSGVITFILITLVIIVMLVITYMILFPQEFCPVIEEYL